MNFRSLPLTFNLFTSFTTSTNNNPKRAQETLTRLLGHRYFFLLMVLDNLLTTSSQCCHVVTLPPSTTDTAPHTNDVAVSSPPHQEGARDATRLELQVWFLFFFLYLYEQFHRRTMLMAPPTPRQLTSLTTTFSQFSTQYSPWRTPLQLQHHTNRHNVDEQQQQQQQQLGLETRVSSPGMLFFNLFSYSTNIFHLTTTFT